MGMHILTSGRHVGTAPQPHHRRLQLCAALSDKINMATEVQVLEDAKRHWKSSKPLCCMCACSGRCDADVCCASAASSRPFSYDTVCIRPNREQQRETMYRKCRSTIVLGCSRKCPEPAGRSVGGPPLRRRLCSWPHMKHIARGGTEARKTSGADDGCGQRRRSCAPVARASPLRTPHGPAQTAASSTPAQEPTSQPGKSAKPWRVTFRECDRPCNGIVPIRCVCGCHPSGAQMALGGHSPCGQTILVRPGMERPKSCRTTYGQLRSELRQSARNWSNLV